MKVDIAARRRRIYQVAEGFARLKWILRGMNEFYEVLPIFFPRVFLEKSRLKRVLDFNQNVKKIQWKLLVYPVFYRVFTRFIEFNWIYQLTNNGCVNGFMTMEVDIAARRRRIYQIAEGFTRLKWILRGMNEFYEVVPLGPWPVDEKRKTRPPEKRVGIEKSTADATPFCDSLFKKKGSRDFTRFPPPPLLEFLLNWTGFV